MAPLRTFQSMGLTPAARTATRIWPGAGLGIRELHELQHLGASELTELNPSHCLGSHRGLAKQSYVSFHCAVLIARARSKIVSSMSSVSRPVNVFCWLG